MPAKAIAIHRMPAAASSSGRPSRTRAKANTRTQDAAKNIVVYTISRLRISTVRSLRMTTHATRRNWVIVRAPPRGAAAAAVIVSR